MRRLVLCCLSGLLAAGLFAAAPARAQQTGTRTQQKPHERGSFSLLVENDVFTGTDRHYTNGLRASWLSPADDLPSYGRWLARNLPFLAADGSKRIGYAVGQNMYTPSNTGTSALIPNDRPYAGWLYGEVSITSETRKRLDSAALSVGVVGPMSGAGWTQRRWHELFNWSVPQGWHNQLKNEPAVNLTVDRQWRYLRRFNVYGLGMDVTPHIGGALGNVFTYGALGATFRIGQNLRDDFGGPPRIRPSLPGSAWFTPRDSFGWYLFAGAEGRAVARNIFLDGNTFAHSHHVHKRVLVGDLQAGIAFVFPRFRVTYTQVFRTKEFYGQDTGDRFGAVSITTRF